MNEDKPIYILPENTQRTLGKDAQRNNIMAAKIVADVVKSTLGPKGMDKMLVDSTGETIVTNDGVTILEEMEIEHPAAKMMVDIAKTQEQEVGDGTTTAALLAGKLLEEAEELLEKKIHATVITKGYRLAAEEALKVLEEVASPVEDQETLRQLAMTAMTGKGAEGQKEHLAGLLVQAVHQVAEGKKVEIGDVKIEKVKGERVEESSLVQGMVLDKERAHGDMPEKIEGAKILLTDVALELKQPEQEAKLSITSPDELQRFIEHEEKSLKDLTDRIIGSGANVVLCQKGIDDVAQYYLAKAGLFACRRVPKSDLEKVARATGGKIVSHLQDVREENFGAAEMVEEVKQGEEGMTFIRGCQNPRAVTLLLRGGTGHVVDEIERAMQDALGDVVAAVRSGRVVAGGGAVEMSVSRRLRAFAKTLGGREQLAVEGFALALESIPEALAENAGMDPIDVLAELRQRQEMGEARAGVNLFTEKVEDTLAAGIVEPLKVKTQAVSSAAEVAQMILRIDDVLISRGGGGGVGSSGAIGGGMPPGMMGMD
ncbi:thermosome subunit [Candidatus Pacearchaeota archaeon]|nr:thermosome subunit [Candidatus Pacearchaeota archaeon]